MEKFTGQGNNFQQRLGLLIGIRGIANMRLITSLTLLSATLAWANSSGPDAGNSGVTSERTCNQAGCHTGTNVNAGGGRVEIQFASGLNYTPGVKQTLRVVITDPNATTRSFGFQVTARLASNTQQRGGGFTVEAGATARTFVWCHSANFLTQVDKSVASGGACPANAQLESIQHASPLPASQGNTFTIEFEPPSTNVGNVQIFVAANAANGNGSSSGDRIYTANYTLQPQAGGNPPQISSGGIIQPGDFGASATVAGSSWVEIYGTNLAPGTADWSGKFTGSNAPTAINGVSVSIGGKAAPIWFTTSGQINAQVPADIGVGPTTVAVTTPSGTSANATVNVAARTPGLWAPASFKRNDRQYVGALLDSSTYVGPSGLVAGLNFRAAKPGETILMYGVGFGATTPAVPAGVIVSQLTSLPNPRVLFGQTQATVSFAGLAPNFIGLYQFNIVVPQVAAGDAQLSVSVDNVNVTQTLWTTVGQ